MELLRPGSGGLDAGTTRKSKLDPRRSRDDARDDAPPPAKRRVLTTARREQNRLAQRAYRKRQKEERKMLKQESQLSIIRPLRPLVKRPVLGNSSVTGHQNATRSSQGSPGRSGSPTQSQGQDGVDIGSGSVLVNQERQIHPTVPGREYSNVALIPVMAPPNTSPVSTCVDLCQAEQGDHSVSCLGGSSELQFLSEPTVDITRQEANEQDENELVMPDAYQNMLQFLPTTIFSAILHNALALGFDLQKLSDCGPDFVSPFYQPDISSNSDPAALVQSSIASFTSTSIPPHLRPTIAQVLIPHHASLDLIPLPFLRQGAIMLSAAMPHAFNIQELKVDIYERGGLAIWQKDGASRYRRDESNSYQPWEMRSWEAAPWFLTKWCMAIGGEQSEFYRQSIGWQVIREVISAQAGA